MRRLILLFIPVLLLLTACAQPRYVWQHESGLGETELQRARKVCNLYADEQTPPSYYWDYPYAYSGHPFYYGGYGYYNRHHYYPYRYRGYYPHHHFSGINTYAYHQDISRACLKGKGWNRIEVKDS